MSTAHESATAEWLVRCLHLATKAVEAIGRGDFKEAGNLRATLRILRQHPPTIEDAERRADIKAGGFYSGRARASWHDDE